MVYLNTFPKVQARLASASATLNLVFAMRFEKYETTSALKAEALSSSPGTFSAVNIALDIKFLVSMFISDILRI